MSRLIPFLLALLIGVAALTGCESTPERGDDRPEVTVSASDPVPAPPRPRGYGAPPFAPPKAKERPKEYDDEAPQDEDPEDEDDRGDDEDD